MIVMLDGTQIEFVRYPCTHAGHRRRMGKWYHRDELATRVMMIDCPQAELHGILNETECGICGFRQDKGNAFVWDSNGMTETLGKFTYRPSTNTVVW